MKTVVFNGWTCLVNKLAYGNGRVALELIDAEDGMPMAVATVNIPEAELEKDEVLIKDWSENEGMLQALVDGGIVDEPIGVVPAGFSVAYMCKLLI